ncbi:MAG: prepilin-type N-terminal cleavage/methylation domain-containing protein [Candidatus Sumerlaeia bacterium]
MIRIWKRKSLHKAESAFTLVEAAISMTIFAVLAVACVQAVQIANMITRQTQENQVAVAFLEDYMENVLAMRYLDLILTEERPIRLLDGIRSLPSSYAEDSWITIDTDSESDPNVLAYPAIVQLAKGEIKPEYQVNIESINDSATGEANAYKVITVRLRWPGARAIRDSQVRSEMEVSARRYMKTDVDFLPR